ncbi:MAG: ribbon-helix-helix protein, CopG family [Thermodesulfobacteriota bacterium]
MAPKRLTIELSVDQYETVRQQAKANGTTISGFLRRMIDDLRLRSPAEIRKGYRNDPFLNRRGSFDGPVNLAENHDHYLYVKE